MLIDSHAHLDDERFDEDRDELINSLKDNNVELVINPGSDYLSSMMSVDLANEHDNIYAAVGVHPHEADSLSDSMLTVLKNLILSNEKVVAVGEIGLDYYYDNSPRDVQRYWFEKQLELAKELKLPVIVHSRDAAGDTFDIIKKVQDGTMTGVIHSFSGSVEMAEEYIKLGYYISLGGPVTFKNSVTPKEVAKAIPLDRLLIETDSPYLTPEPFRGRRNDPTKVLYVAEKIAEIRQIEVKELISTTNKNTKKLFNIK